MMGDVAHMPGKFMTNHAISSEDFQFQRAFEAFEVDPSAFGHAAHVRLAYIYLCQHSTEVAAERMRSSLLSFLEHLGVGRAKFHETITTAWTKAIRHFMALSKPSSSAVEFIESNPRLLDTQIMLTHYSAPLLFSPVARSEFVTPDLAPIPEYG